MSNDLFEMADKIFANISSDGKPAPPHNPCPKCGRESAEHTLDPDTGGKRMICMHPSCRAVQVMRGGKFILEELLQKTTNA